MRHDAEQIPTQVNDQRVCAAGRELGQVIADNAAANRRKRELEESLDRLGIPAYLRRPANS